MKQIPYQYIQELRGQQVNSLMMNRFESNRWKIGGFQHLSDDVQNRVGNCALSMAQDLDEIHRIVSSANGNEVEIVEAIQSMFMDKVGD